MPGPADNSNRPHGPRPRADSRAHRCCSCTNRADADADAVKLLSCGPNLSSGPAGRPACSRQWAVDSDQDHPELAPVRNQLTNHSHT